MKKIIIPLFAFTFALHLLSARAESYNLIGQRHLRLYTAPYPSQAYNASVDAQTIANMLCNVPWTRARSLNATSTSHVNEQLDAYGMVSGETSLKLSCTAGRRTVYAVVNAAEELSGITSKAEFLKSYRLTGPIARRTGFSEMVSHRFLSPDRRVQRTEFADGTVVIANFGDRPVSLPEATVPANAAWTSDLR